MEDRFAATFCESFSGSWESIFAIQLTFAGGEEPVSLARTSDPLLRRVVARGMSSTDDADDALFLLEEAMAGAGVGVLGGASCPSVSCGACSSISPACGEMRAAEWVLLISYHRILSKRW